MRQAALSDASELARFVEQHRQLTVLSGAGCSTASGIPEYRDDAGRWKHARPVQYADFIGSAAVRQRYWARSYVGWTRIARARPNEAHYALAALERRGYVNQLITQNVDNLHRLAGSRRVIDLHGVLHTVRCLGCGRKSARRALQDELERSNRGWSPKAATVAPDGDAGLDDGDVACFEVPDCRACGGILKPDVVFFGENVPRERVRRCRDTLGRSQALLVVGSSLMVFSGFRFAREARAAGKPVAIINRGKTRADEFAARRFVGDCGELLGHVARYLAA